MLQLPSDIAPIHVTVTLSLEFGDLLQHRHGWGQGAYIIITWRNQNPGSRGAGGEGWGWGGGWGVGGP